MLINFRRVIILVRVVRLFQKGDRDMVTVVPKKGDLVCFNLIGSRRPKGREIIARHGAELPFPVVGGPGACNCYSSRPGPCWADCPSRFVTIHTPSRDEEVAVIDLTVVASVEVQACPA